MEAPPVVGQKEPGPRKDAQHLAKGGGPDETHGLCVGKTTEQILSHVAMPCDAGNDHRQAPLMHNDVDAVPEKSERGVFARIAGPWRNRDIGRPGYQGARLLHKLRVEPFGEGDARAVPGQTESSSKLEIIPHLVAGSGEVLEGGGGTRAYPSGMAEQDTTGS
jgi:hypothetical protein